MVVQEVGEYIEEIAIKTSDGTTKYYTLPSNCVLVKLIFEMQIKA